MARWRGWTTGGRASRTGVGFALAIAFVPLSAIRPVAAQSTSASAPESQLANEARAETDWPLLGAGGDEHAWLLIPRREDPTAAGRAAATRANLYHLPGDEPAGTVFAAPGHRVGASPVAMAARRNRLILVFEAQPARSEGQDGEKVRPVRLVETTGLAAGEVYRYSPADRYTVLAAMPGDGRLAGLIDSAAGPVALLRPADDAADRADSQPASRLLRLRDGEWKPIDLPSDIDESSQWRLTHVDDRIALYELRAEGGARLWRRDEGGEGPAVWTSEPIASIEPDAVLLAGEHGLFAVRRDSAGDVRIVLLRGESAYETATIADVPPEHATLRLGETVIAAWIDEEAGGRLRLAVVSALHGRTLHRGEPRMPSPIRPEDVRFLALLLGALMLGVLVFLLRPESLSGEATVPAGWAPAPPSKRLIAAAIDLTVSGVAASLIWRAPLSESLDLRYLLLLQGGGAWPVLTTLGLTLAHSAVSERLWGRTLGKAIARCRTVSVSGARPALWQSATRNAVKLVAPPLTALLLLDPLRRHPGDVLSGTLVIARADSQEPDASESDSDSDSGEA